MQKPARTAIRLQCRVRRTDERSGGVAGGGGSGNAWTGCAAVAGVLGIPAADLDQLIHGPVDPVRLPPPSVGDLIDRAGADVPFGWVAGDDELGRATAFREGLRVRKLRYVLDVPANTLIRDLGETPAPGKRRPPWRRVDAWAKAQPASRWRKVAVGDGAQGPKVVRALAAWVQTEDEGGRVGPRERRVVIRTVDQEPQTWYTLSNAPAEVPLAKAVEVHARRHGVEELLQAGKGEVGLGHYEVRSWVGWHHHRTLSLLALWFLILEKSRVGKKIPALPVPQLREVFARLLQPDPPSPARIAREVSRVLRRTEEARIDPWYKATKKFPPRRARPDG